MGSNRPPRASTASKRRKVAHAGDLDLPSNVIPLHLRITARHAEILALWLEAGRCMGLSDASTFVPARHAGSADRWQQNYVVIWVRENIDPAYTIVPDGHEWDVTDAIRSRSLGRFRRFEEALNFIRPVLPLEAAA